MLTSLCVLRHLCCQNESTDGLVLSSKHSGDEVQVSQSGAYNTGTEEGARKRKISCDRGAGGVESEMYGKGVSPPHPTREYDRRSIVVSSPSGVRDRAPAQNELMHFDAPRRPLKAADGEDS